MLKDLAKHYINQDISNHCFVFPNRRAGLFFKKYLEQYAEKTMIMPEVLTIADVYQNHSKYKIADKLTLLFELYSVYKEILVENSKVPESFDAFISFGETLLADFNDIDTYLIDAEKLFINIDDYQALTSTDYLNDQQKEILEKLFGTMLEQPSKLKDNFKSIWALMYPIYTKFKASLEQKGMAYAGMQQRAVVEQHKVTGIDTEYTKVIFVGFNALNEAERQLFKEFGSKADFYWDYNLPLVNDEKNLAYRFAKENISKFPTKEKIELTPAPADTAFYNVVVPSMTAQASETKKILNKLKSNNINTVVVLLDEQMLLPTLLELPIDEQSKVNVTMGYPISHTPIIDFIEQFILLQNTASDKDFYHKHVLALLAHPYVQTLDLERVGKLSDEIIQKNKVRITTNDIIASGIENEIFGQIFSHCPENEILERSIQIASKIKTSNEYDEECLAQVLLVLNNINRLMKEYSMVMAPLTLLKTIKQTISTISVSFKGEPLNGLQIMGTLETRCLSFENVIFMSFNEGIFPKSSHSNSIIPYSLRIATGLPTTEHQDAVYAYNFYRLIARAKNVYMLSDSRTENMKSGEPSRYLKQLRYIYNKNIVDIDVTSNISVPQPATEFSKPDDFAQKILDKKINISASAIKTYQNCPCKFYIQYYLGINEEIEVSEIMESNQLGSIFHKAAELLYTDLQANKQGGDITKDILEQAKGNTPLLERYITKAFKIEYFKIPKEKIDSTTVEIKGVNMLMSKLILAYLKSTLTEDIKKTPFKVVECERKCEEDYIITQSELFADKKVHFKGYIDRLDSYTDKDGRKHLRVIDYKSGKVDLKLTGKKTLTEILLKPENGPLCQLLMYEYFLKNATKNKLEFDELDLEIYTLSMLGKSGYQTKIDTTPEMYAAYLQGLDETLNDMLDQNVKITRAKNTHDCKYCKFASTICPRLK